MPHYDHHHDQHHDDATEQEASWPYASLLIFGFFGTDSPEGRRLARQTTIILGLMVIAAFVLSLPGVPLAVRIAAAALLPLGVLGMGLSYAAYIRDLDELSRSLQLKAFAVAYIAVMTIALGIVAYDVLTPGPVVFDAGVLVLLVIAEPVRAAALAWLARRYA